MPDDNSASDVATVMVTLPVALVNLFPGSSRHVTLQATMVRGAIDALNARWPGMRDRICDSTPAIRRHMNVFVDGQRATLQTALRPGADVLVMTAISGG